MGKEFAMGSSLTDQLYDQLGRYLAGIQTLQEFDQWFVPATWHIDPSSDPDLAGLAGEVYLRVAEFTIGHRTEEELKTLLRGIARDYKVHRSDSIQSSDSTNRSIRLEHRVIAGGVFGIPRVVASA
jgi:hypothetical protein